MALHIKLPGIYIESYEGSVTSINSSRSSRSSTVVIVVLQKEMQEVGILDIQV